MRWPRRSKASSGTSRISGATSGASAFGSRMPHWPDASASPNAKARMISGLPRPGDHRQRELRAGGRELAHQRQRIDLALQRHEAGDDRAGPIASGNGRAAIVSAACARRRRGRRIAPRQAHRWRMIGFESRGRVSMSWSSRRPGGRKKCGAAMSRRISTPGTYRSRWAPYVRAHGPGQGQLPSGS